MILASLKLPFPPVWLFNSFVWLTGGRLY
jgi:hypothetical protein